MSWEKTKIGDHCEITSSKRIFYSEYTDSGVPFYRSKEIIESSQGQPISEPLYISTDKYNDIKSKFGVPLPGDMLLTSVGTIGIPYIVHSDDYFYFKDGNLTWFRNFDDSLSSKFLCYWIGSKDGYGVLNNTTIGSSQKALTISSLKQIECPLPPIEVQNRIVDILSAYDALIKNNQKQIKLLEEAAQRLYKEWFVDLRFPGYEYTPIVDGVPEGWDKVPVGNLISYEIGGGWGEETPAGKCIREAYVIRGTDLYGIAHGDLLSIPFRYHVESNLSSRKLKDGDIVFEVSGGSRTEGVARCLLITSSMLNVWRKDVMCASFCKLIRPQFGFSQYLHDCIKHLRATGKTEEYDKRSASSIVNYRWKDFLSQELVLRPSEEVLDHYNGVAKEIYSKAINCSLQIESAKKARDRLLPKLISGEIEV